MRVRNTIALFSTSLLCVIISAQPSPSQTRQRLAQNGASQPAPQQTETQAQGPRLTVPTDDVLLILIRATLIALNQANVTGNYTVLRDLGAPASPRRTIAQTSSLRSSPVFASASSI